MVFVHLDDIITDPGMSNKASSWYEGVWFHAFL